MAALLTNLVLYKLYLPFVALILKQDIKESYLHATTELHCHQQVILERMRV